MRRVHLVFALGLAGVACGGAESQEIVSTSVSAVRTFDVPKVDGNVAPGFDLDGLTSDLSDGRTCYHADLTSPDGAVGIDNQLATLIPFFDVEGEGAFGALIQQAINDGRLLLLFELAKRADDTHELRIYRGDDKPLLGTDGLLLADQTLAAQAGEPLVRAEIGAIAGKTIEIGPVDLSIPVVVFDGTYDMHMPEGRVRMQLDDEGNIVGGVLGGGIPMESLNKMLAQAAVRLPSFVSVLRSTVEEATDMALKSDGSCDQMSAAIVFDSVSAYKF